MAQLLENAGYARSELADEAELIIVNTCGFIAPARDESLRILSELAAHKRKGQLLIAAGCLTQRYGIEVAQKVAGIDGILGTRRWMDIVEVVQRLQSSQQAGRPDRFQRDAPPSGWRRERRRVSGKVSPKPVRSQTVQPGDVPSPLLGTGVPPERNTVGMEPTVQPGDVPSPLLGTGAPPERNTVGMTPTVQPVYHLPEAADMGPEEPGVLRVAVQGASAYLKIADGCRRRCAFCAIPLIKGRPVSRPLQAILREAHQLQARRVKELILIAQDTTDYGSDLGLKDGLATLLERLVEEAPEIPWLRILYAFPGYVTDRLIEVMASHPQILPYLDMPLQHAHPATLRRMRRPANLDWVYRTLEKIRAAMPALALRSTFIVGYPGETEDEFDTLLDFVREIRFDRLGAFQFSFEPGTASQALGDPIPPEVKQARWERLMEVQQGISLSKNQAFVGQTLQVLIEGQAELLDEERSRRNLGQLSVGRSYRDAPEIDGVVLVEGDLPVGSFVSVRITSAMPYDLSGVVSEK